MVVQGVYPLEWSNATKVHEIPRAQWLLAHPSGGAKVDGRKVGDFALAFWWVLADDKITCLNLPLSHKGFPCCVCSVPKNASAMV